MNSLDICGKCPFFLYEDANGNEIYEGDIIQSPTSNKPTHVIVYDDKFGCYMAKQLYYEHGAYCHIYQDWIDEFKKVIIGNIYDNTELLESEATDD